MALSPVLNRKLKLNISNQMGVIIHMLNCTLVSASIPPGPNQANNPTRPKAKVKPKINPASDLVHQSGCNLSFSAKRAMAYFRPISEIKGTKPESSIKRAIQIKIAAPRVNRLSQPIRLATVMP